MEFCSYFEQIADSPNFLRKLALEFCLRPKSLKLRHSSNWAANLFKIWQNSNASLSIVYLFFIIYQKSKVWTITRLKNLSGWMYVKHYRFLFWQWQTNIIIANTVKHTHPLKFSNLVIAHTLDFRYMIKNK